MSLERRYEASAERFETVPSGRSVSQSFRQPPKAQFKRIAYDCPPSRRVFDLRDPDVAEKSVPWPIHRTYTLCTTIRDQAVQRLTGAIPSQRMQIDRWLVGRKPDGANGGSPQERIRLIPLPSIGHARSDFKIRRLLVEVPSGCPLRNNNIFWAFSGLRFEISGAGGILTPSPDAGMEEHYIAERGATRWRSITPVALPEGARRRRIEPSRRLVEAKGSLERAEEQIRAANAVVNALRHADIVGRVEQVIVQREPFAGHGERAEHFAEGSRFPKQRLWHVELAFAEPCSGVMVIGDGQFCGFGIMAPVT